jgi:Ca-activated chloride channel family protein
MTRRIGDEPPLTKPPTKRRTIARVATRESKGRLCGRLSTPMVRGSLPLLGLSFFIFICLAMFQFSPCAQAQSTDEVHVVPRNGSDHTAPQPALEPPNSDSPLNAHTKPLRADVDLVLIPATVTDGRNRPVTDLQRQNFTIYEENAQQQIRNFSTEDAPISVGLILDVSKSMTNKIETERAAVAEFFNGGNPEDDYFVITLGDRPRIIADTTQSLEEIQAKLALVIPNGNTALLDGIYLGVDKLSSARYRRRALLIISDGGDNHSHYTPKETKSLIQEADVLIYSIGIFDSMPVPVFKTIEEKLGKRLLTEMTEASGGRTIAADNRAKVPEIAAAISRELREQYVLGYRSSNALHDGKWRKIKVQVTASEGVPPLRAYYKKGYLAPEK